MTSENKPAGPFAMTRLLSILHLRPALVGALAVTVVMIVGLRLGFHDWDQGSGAAWLVSLGIPVVALSTVLFFMAAGLRPQRYLRDMDRMPAGRCWAHWHYDEAAWKAANDVEGRREQEQRASYAVPLRSAVAGSVVMAVGAAGDVHGIIVVGMTIAGVALLCVVARGTNALQRATLTARRRSRGEILVGPLGVYRRPGGYTALYGLGFSLREVDLVDATGRSPAFLRFTVRAKGELWPLTDVAVPPGREEEARALVRRFRTEVLTSP